jgi:hypothetical protein
MGINNTPKAGQAKFPGLLFELFLIALILTGIFFRFNWVNWSQDTNLHPDEYGLTNTLTQLAIPKTVSDYFNTRISSLSPYQKYDINGAPTTPGPDNRMRWGQFPLLIIRMAGEATGNTGYGEIRLLGRSLSALADTLSLLFIFLIGLKLYGRRVGLLAAALSALAVMQIQQSHFMTVDNFGGLFTTLAMFACVQIAQKPLVSRRPRVGTGTIAIENDAGSATYTLTPGAWVWVLLFGAAFGMALACKVNLLPIGGMLLIAAFISIADLKLRSQKDLWRIFGTAGALIALAFLIAGAVFRITQPMSFRATSGDTSLFSLQPNPDWVDSMKVASAESSGEGGGPPGEQWAHRPAIVFPFVNMVLWGLGLPLGLAAWSAFGAAFWQVLRSGKNWQVHSLPLVWIGGYFLFMGTRWVKSVRYFLPIYPFLCLLAAWGLISLWKWATEKSHIQNRPLRLVIACTALGVTILGTLAWANAFTQAVYQTDHTRIQATRWIFQNIAGPFHLSLQTPDGATVQEPLEAPNDLQISSSRPYILPFRLRSSGQLQQVIIPHARVTQESILRVVIARDPGGKEKLAETTVSLKATQGPVTGVFSKTQLTTDNHYFLIVSTTSEEPISISRNVIANESWDEGLPVPFDGRDPFGQLYRGLTMEVRWPDDEHKRQVMLATLQQADYLILPSQRSIWATCRIPNTYPMTMEYYRALFDGRLGFEQVSIFSAPLKLGPLWISDVGGTLAWNKTPALPLFNHNLLAAEEAFSVYDHPPVWIFKKRSDFSLQQATDILNRVDLTRVIAQSPLNANGDWCPGQ